MDPTSRIEKLNQIVRAFCVTLLVLVFCAVFVIGAIAVLRDPQKQSMLISVESFLLILNTVLIWWFKSRDEQQRRADFAAPGGPTNGTTKTPDSTPAPQPRGV